MKVLNSMTSTPAAGIVTLILGLIVTADMAPAAQPSQAQASTIRSSCRSDYRSHCASLQKNFASLSPACQKAVNAVGAGAPAPPATTPVTSAPAAAATSAAPAPSPSAAAPTTSATATPASPAAARA